jgi:NAD(P)-dependent dehydrogenase (short-subunit alcohol dehydrogenase family)
MDDRVVVITGGTGGLGTALVRRLVDEDVRLAVTYIQPDEAAAFEEAFDFEEDRLLLRRVDATNPETVSSFMKEVVDRWGAIHQLASLVGGWAGGRDVEETDDVRFERMLDLNLRSAFYAVRAAVPYLRQSEWGRILLIGSRAVEDTPPGQAAFNIAKAGVVALGKTLAQELEGSGVTANVLMPSVIDTPATRAALPYADYVHWPTPDEIAAVAEADLSTDDEPAIRQPTKLIRIASMTRAMLDEVRQAPLDEAGRIRLMEVHQRSLQELRGVLSAELLQEFDDIFQPIRGDGTPSESELRIAQAQLIGWLEGLFHGIQASLFSQQMAAQAQLAEMQRRQQLGPRSDESSGLYL